MNKKTTNLGLGGVLLAWSGWIFLAEPSSATLSMQKKAKDLGFSVENCLYCHGEKMPKKDAVTFNDRGKWLVAEKQKRNAKEVDVSWLKEYPGDKK